MPTFTPPANATEDPPVDEDATPIQRALFRHYRGRPVGRNVYLYSDGTVSEVDPDGLHTFARQEEGSPYAQGKSKTAAFFQGGTGPYTITAAQATLLTNAGYTVT